MDIANIFIIYHINRKNTKESNAGILYIEKKLKAECVSMNLNSLPHIKGIKHYLYQFMLLSITCSTFTYAVACIRIPFLFKVA